MVAAGVSITVFAANYYSGTGVVTIKITPERTSYNVSETEATQIRYTVSISPPDDGYLGAFQFKFLPDDGMTLSTVSDAESGYFVNMQHQYLEGESSGIFAFLSYSATTNVFVASGTVPPEDSVIERVLREEIEIMSIVATVEAGREGEFELSVSKTVEELVAALNGYEQYSLEDIEIITTPVTIAKGVGYDIKGEISTSDNSRDIELTLLHASSDIAVATETLTAGTKIFTFTAVQNGTYDILVEKVGALPLLIKDVVVSGANIDYTIDGSGYEIFKMIEGNVNGDGKVNFDDLAVIRNQNNYNKLTSDSGVNPNADINGDGRVDFTDLSVVRNQLNYNKTTTDSVIIIVE